MSGARAHARIRAMIGLAAAAASAALRGLAATLRIEFRGREHWQGLAQSGRPFLFAVWHGRMLLPILVHRKESVIGLVSLSKDGDFATAVLRRLGYEAVRGSSSRGGREAFHELRDVLGPGRSAAIIPDGPKGPARALKPGIVRLASLTGAAILPLSAAAQPGYRLASWDRFLLPWPFARAVVVYGTPIDVAPELATEPEDQLRIQVKRELDRLEAEADAILGVQP